MTRRKIPFVLPFSYPCCPCLCDQIIIKKSWNSTETSNRSIRLRGKHREVQPKLPAQREPPEQTSRPTRPRLPRTRPGEKERKATNNVSVDALRSRKGKGTYNEIRNSLRNKLEHVVSGLGPNCSGDLQSERSDLRGSRPSLKEDGVVEGLEDRRRGGSARERSQGGRVDEGSLGGEVGNQRELSDDGWEELGEVLVGPEGCRRSKKRRSVGVEGSREKQRKKEETNQLGRSRRTFGRRS